MSTVPTRTTDDLLHRRYTTRIVVVSPPRTASTVVARMLWQHSAVSHHCHEPFEGAYWGGDEAVSADAVLARPMHVKSGTTTSLDQVPPGSGLLIKEMSFQLDIDQFVFLTELATAPVIFVVRDPRLSTTSRLRIVAELFGSSTFPPFESGWPSLVQQVDRCRDSGIPHVIVDSADLRTAPDAVTARLLTELGLADESGLADWAPRPGLQLCAPEVGVLMSEQRRTDDPFYRRVLGSSGVQPVDDVDWAHEGRLIRDAGLEQAVARWLDDYAHLRRLPTYLSLS